MVRASNILMRKLGITSDARPPDVQALHELEETFDAPLIDEQLEELEDLIPNSLQTLQGAVSTNGV